VELLLHLFVILEHLSG